MILTASSNGTVQELTNSWHRYSDLPPSYDSIKAEPHGFADGNAPPLPLPSQVPSESPASEIPSTTPNDPLTPNRLVRDQEPTLLYLDPSTGEPHATCMISDALLAQCAQQGHVEKTKFGTLGILAAAVFFPWGLLCLMGSRIVYCERCGLVLRGPRGCKVPHRERQPKPGHS